MNAQTGVLIDLCTEPDPNYSESKRDAVFTAPLKLWKRPLRWYRRCPKASGMKI